MIHYSIWFNFKDEVEEAEGLAVVHAFLDELYSGGEVARFQLLKNSGAANRTKMLPFQALIEFRDDTQFAAAFSAQTARGIHTGLHGQVLSLVSDFQIDVFRQFVVSGSASDTQEAHHYGCEV